MKKVVASVVLSAVIFSTMEVALKLGGAGLDNIQLTFLRFFIGAIVLVPPAILECRKSGYKTNIKDLAWMAATGVMGVSISMLSFQIGVMNSNASTAAPVVCTNSMFAMLVAHLFTSEKMSKRKWTAFILGLVALFFMIRPWDMQEGNSVLGFLTLILAAITFGAYTVMGKQTIARIGTFTQTSIGFFFGSAVLLVALLVTGRPVVAGVAENLPLVLYLGVIVTGLGYLVYFLGVLYSDASTGSIAFFVKPAIAPFIAIAVLHETVYWNTIVGIGLLLTGSVLTIYDTFAHRKAMQAKQLSEELVASEA